MPSDLNEDQDDIFLGAHTTVPATNPSANLSDKKVKEPNPEVTKALDQIKSTVGESLRQALDTSRLDATTKDKLKEKFTSQINGYFGNALKQSSLTEDDKKDAVAKCAQILAAVKKEIFLSRIELFKNLYMTLQVEPPDSVMANDNIKKIVKDYKNEINKIYTENFNNAEKLCQDTDQHVNNLVEAYRKILALTWAKRHLEQGKVEGLAFLEDALDNPELTMEARTKFEEKFKLEIETYCKGILTSKPDSLNEDDVYMAGKGCLAIVEKASIEVSKFIEMAKKAQNIVPTPTPVLEKPKENKTSQPTQPKAPIDKKVKEPDPKVTKALDQIKSKVGLQPLQQALDNSRLDDKTKEKIKEKFTLKINEYFEAASKWSSLSRGDKKDAEKQCGQILEAVKKEIFLSKIEKTKDHYIKQPTGFSIKAKDDFKNEINKIYTETRKDAENLYKHADQHLKNFQQKCSKILNLTEAREAKKKNSNFIQNDKGLLEQPHKTKFIPPQRTSSSYAAVLTNVSQGPSKTAVNKRSILTEDAKKLIEESSKLSEVDRLNHAIKESLETYKKEVNARTNKKIESSSQDSGVKWAIKNKAQNENSGNIQKAATWLKKLGEESNPTGKLPPSPESRFSP